MKIIAGLGNPGQEYAESRHNAGFILLDQIQKIYSFPPFALEKKFQAEVSRAKISDQDVLLIKPQTFMNRSGDALSLVVNFFKLSPSDVFVAHDDLDIELGKWKITKNSGPGGHNGIISVIEKLGAKDFARIKIGIEGEERKKIRKIPGEKFVLQKFSEEERVLLEKAMAEIIPEIETKLKTSDS